jgi:transglutaminase-like putative cysteine protease
MARTGGGWVRAVGPGALLLALAAGYTGFGLRLFDQYRDAHGNVASACDAFVSWKPPTRVFTGFYPNQAQLVTVRYRSNFPQLLRVTVSISHFTQEQSVDLQGTTRFQEQAFKPPLLNADVLDTLVSPGSRDGQMLLSVRTPSGKTCDTSSTVRLESRQLMQWQDADGHDQADYLAGWVTPQAPEVSSLVSLASAWLADPAHASDYPDAPALFGYNGGKASPRAVTEQVNALFDTLQFKSHLQYVNENVPYQEGATQLIQLPKDVLSNSPPTGMCVETTVLLASAAERIGLRTYIVIVPQHAFLGVALGTAASAPIGYWETSLLGGGDDGDHANLFGTSEYNRYMSQNQVLHTVDVELERQRGIEPIE